MTEIRTIEDTRKAASRGLYSQQMIAPVNQIIDYGPNPDRLCSPGHECGHGDHEHGGCRRTDTILEWERENTGQYLPAVLDWGYYDYYFKHGGFIYYDKSFLEKVLNDDKVNVELDSKNIFFQSLVKEIRQVVDIDFGQVYSENLVLSLDDIRALIKSSPVGLPPFVKETEHFFVFQDVSTELINGDNLNAETLKKIQSVFGNVGAEYGYTCYDPIDSMYLHDGNVYLLDPTSWIKLDSVFGRKYFTLGVMVPTQNSIKFYPYNPVDQLTSDETAIINILGKLFAKETRKSFVIENL